MSFLDAFNDPYNRRILGAGLKDMTAGFAGNSTDHVGAVVNNESKRKLQQIQLEEARARLKTNKSARERIAASRKLAGEIFKENGFNTESVLQLGAQYPLAAKQFQDLFPTNNAPHNLQKLMQLRETFPAGSKDRMDVERAIRKAVSPSAPLVQVGNNLKQFEGEGTGRLIRAEGASREIEALDVAGIDRLNVWDTAFSTLLPDEYSSALMSDEGKQFIQARNNWIENFGRTESGGVIGPNEYKAWVGIYFTRYTDPPEVKAMKARARRDVEQAFSIGAGKGAEMATKWAKTLKGFNKNVEGETTYVWGSGR